MSKPSAIYPSVGIFVLVLLVLGPGLYGTFYLDDFPNLSPLIWVDEPGRFWHVVLSSDSGPSGRPLSILSFALQAGAWPSNPFAFKFFNLVLHGANGVLVLALTHTLLRLAPVRVRHPVAISVATALLWGLAPIHLASVFYVVQRMTLLSAFFTLVGLLGYLNARSLWLEGRGKAGFLLASIALTLTLSLGILSKENAILMPVYVLVLEATVLRRVPRPKGWLIWCSVFLCLPLLATAVYLTVHQHDLSSYAFREFSPIQRLLTETRVLVNYLAATLFPSSNQLGLFHDDLSVSQGLLAPPTTLASTLALLGALSAALALRKRQPVLAMAVLWFLGGHSLESTILGLELYFEHRNYLPVYGPLLALVWYGINLTDRFKAQTLKGLTIAIGLAYMGMVGFVAHQEARLWGDPQAMAESKLRDHPDSLRARIYAASERARAENFSGAGQLLAAYVKKHGMQASVLARIFYLRCFDPRIQVPGGEEWIESLSLAPYDRTLVAVFYNLVTSKEKGECPNVSYRLIEQLLDTVVANPRFGPANAQLNRLLARTRSRMGDYEGTINALTSTQSEGLEPELFLLKAAYALKFGRLRDAERFLSEAEEKIRALTRRHAVSATLFGRGRWERNRLEALRRSLRLAHANSGRTGSGPVRSGFED